MVTRSVEETSLARMKSIVPLALYHLARCVSVTRYIPAVEFQTRPICSSIAMQASVGRYISDTAESRDARTGDPRRGNTRPVEILVWTSMLLMATTRSRDAALVMATVKASSMSTLEES